MAEAVLLAGLAAGDADEADAAEAEDAALDEVTVAVGVLVVGPGTGRVGLCEGCTPGTGNACCLLEPH